MAATPTSATLFTFNVGFGDCFLLRFQYDDDTRRHILIDFGSTRLPRPCPKSYLTKVAVQIKDLCGGKLDIIVATHRHKDHIYGFRTNKKGTAPGNIIASCNPSLVLQPWTEHPNAETEATFSPDQKSFSKALLNMSRFSGAVHRAAMADEKIAQSKTGSPKFTDETRKALSFLGENNITNKSAVNNLMSMGKKRLYLSFGQDAEAADILPGIDLDVLGPPTLEQNPVIKNQRARHEEEYWHLQAAAAGAGLAAQNGDALFPDAVAEPPTWARWGKYRLRRMHADMLMPIVRRLDQQMNNTSLILLFTVGGKSLLFPGDAQWENWSHALSQPDIRDKLKTVDIYKVGHHGSLNATPKSLWDLFENRGASTKPDRLTSVMSTRHGVHGHSPETAVPRQTLVDELKTKSRFITTEDRHLGTTATKFYDEIMIGLS